MKRTKSRSKPKKGKCRYCKVTVNNLKAHDKEKHLNQLRKEQDLKRKIRL